MKTACLGDHNVDNQANLAKKMLEKTISTREICHWNFKKHVKTHVDQHITLEGLMPLGHSGTDERSKVRHLNAGIKTPKLDVPRTQIIFSTSLHSNFEGAVAL